MYRFAQSLEFAGMTLCLVAALALGMSASTAMAQTTHAGCNNGGDDAIMCQGEVDGDTCTSETGGQICDNGNTNCKCYSTKDGCQCTTGM